MRLNDYQTRSNILDAMSIPFFSGGTTNTAGALRFMREDMFRNGGYIFTIDIIFIVARLDVIIRHPVRSV